MRTRTRAQVGEKNSKANETIINQTCSSLRLVSHVIMNLNKALMGRGRPLFSLIIVLVNVLAVREDHVLDVAFLSSLTYDSPPGFLNRTHDGIGKGKRDGGRREVEDTSFSCQLATGTRFLIIVKLIQALGRRAVFGGKSSQE